MEDLNFNPHKSTKAFRRNYKLHDLAEVCGKNLLIQWGFRFGDFGKDKRYEKVWESGKDKPDLVIEYKNKRALLDWKGKHKPVWLINKRAVNSYKAWHEKLNLPVLVCFAVFDENKELVQFRFAFLGKHNYSLSEGKEWDKNSTVEFQKDLPEFTKGNMIKYLL
jgi:hypothetical protein